MSVNQERDVNQVVTRLRIKGKDDINVMSCSPDGQPYIDNFSYFMNSKYMSNELINALNIYNAIVSGYKDVQEDFTYTAYQSGSEITRTVTGLTFGTMLEKRNSVIEEYNKYKVAYDQYIVIVEEDESLSSWATVHDEQDTDEYKVRHNAYQEQIASIMFSVGMAEISGETYIYSEQDLIDRYLTLESKLNAYNNQIAKMQRVLRYENVQYNGTNLFTDDLLSELSDFVFEEILDVSTISDEQALYEYGVQYLKYLCEIPISISANLIDIYGVSNNGELINYWKRLNSVGDYAVIHYPQMGFEYRDFRMMEITHSISATDSSLSISLSNKEELSTQLEILINNVWNYAYRLSIENADFRSSWERYATKMNEMIIENQRISAEKNQITNKSGALVLDTNGIVPSRQSGNSIITANDGIYCKTTKIVRYG